MSKSAVDPRVLGVSQISTRTSLSKTQVRNLIVAGELGPIVKLPSPRVGERRTLRRLLVRVEDVDRWIDAHLGQYEAGEFSVKKAG